MRATSSAPVHRYDELLSRLVSLSRPTSLLLSTNSNNLFWYLARNLSALRSLAKHCKSGQPIPMSRHGSPFHIRVDPRGSGLPDHPCLRHACRSSSCAQGSNLGADLAVCILNLVGFYDATSCRIVQVHRLTDLKQDGENREWEYFPTLCLTWTQL